MARVFHRLASPAFKWADWKDNRYWGKHADVDFEAVRRMADEVLETVRRAHLASMKAARKRDCSSALIVYRARRRLAPEPLTRPSPPTAARTVCNRGDRTHDV